MFKEKEHTPKGAAKGQAASGEEKETTKKGDTGKGEGEGDGEKQQM